MHWRAEDGRTTGRLTRSTSGILYGNWGSNNKLALKDNYVGIKSRRWLGASIQSKELALETYKISAHYWLCDFSNLQQSLGGDRVSYLTLHLVAYALQDVRISSSGCWLFVILLPKFSRVLFLSECIDGSQICITLRGMWSAFQNRAACPQIEPTTVASEYRDPEIIFPPGHTLSIHIWRPIIIWRFSFLFSVTFCTRRRFESFMLLGIIIWIF